MMGGVPGYVSATFIVTTVATIGFLFYAIKNAAAESPAGRAAAAVVSFWLFFQAVIALGGFYSSIPGGFPRFPLSAPVPAVLFAAYFIVFHWNSVAGRLSLKTLTLLHVVRVPAEIVLYWLFVSRQVPRAMTFEGANFDIVVGITAPFAAILLFRSGKPRRIPLLVWNILSAALVINIVTIALFSLETPFQRFGLRQPNVAVLHFPYIWLPAVIVPIVLFSHAVSIIRLLKKDNPAQSACV